ncbi:MAG: hypothetical protein ACJ75H_21990 [Thermoanaerobaculia bacterium]
MTGKTSRRRLHPALVLLALALVPAAGWAEPCTSTATALCLGEGARFTAEVTWTAPGLGSGQGQAMPLTADAGLFWFFDNANVELVVKVLDGRLVNGHFWVFFGSLSNVAYTLTVTDTQTGIREIYQNPAGRFFSGANTSAFRREGDAPLRIKSAFSDGPGPVVAEQATAAPVRLGPETRINQTTMDMQRRPDVAVAPDGGYLVVWEGFTPPYGADSMDVYARLYDAQGRPRGNEFRVNERTDGIQWQPRVAASPAGGFMVVWQDGFSGAGVRGRALGADGQPRTDELSFSTQSSHKYTPDVAADRDGGYLVVWNQSPDLNSETPTAIHGQRVDGRGNPLGGDILVSGSQGAPRVAALADGGFVVAWVTPVSTVDYFDYNANARRLDASGQPQGSPYVVNADLPRDGINFGAVPVAHADGGFSVVWGMQPRYNVPAGDAFGLWARRFADDGTPGAPVQIYKSRNLYSAPVAVALPSGDSWVVWSEGDSARDPWAGLQAALFDRDWNRASAAAAVNTYTGYEQTEPGADASGDHIVAVWQSGVDYSPILPPANYGQDTQDGSFYGVFGQRFTVATCAVASNQICLGGRFRAEVSFTSPWTGRPEAGQPIPLTADTGAFWFFQPENVELVIKVLDGRAVNGRFWVYFGALSDVEYVVTVTDTLTQKVKTYRNVPHQQASRADGAAF